MQNWLAPTSVFFSNWKQTKQTPQTQQNNKQTILKSEDTQWTEQDMFLQLSWKVEKSVFSPIPLKKNSELRKTNPALSPTLSYDCFDFKLVLSSQLAVVGLSSPSSLQKNLELLNCGSVVFQLDCFPKSQIDAILAPDAAGIVERHGGAKALLVVADLSHGCWVYESQKQAEEEKIKVVRIARF